MSLEEYYKYKTVLVTGGAGSIGSALVKALVNVGTLRVKVLDISENGLFQLKLDLEPPRGTMLEFVLGDIRNRDSIKPLLRDCALVIHCAALKHLETGNISPHEVYLTNVEGTRNLVVEALESRVEKFIFLSTDKAVYSTNVYGASKLMGEKLVLNANKETHKTEFSIIRFGNVRETEGNVFRVWRHQQERGLPLTVTHPDMRRYYMSLDEAVSFIVEHVKKINRGEIRIPRMEEFSILALAKELSENIVITKQFEGEKQKERLYTDAESKCMHEYEWGWIIN